MGSYFNFAYKLLRMPIKIFGFTFSFFELFMFIIVVSIIFMLIGKLMK